MYSCVHLSIKEHQFYKSIELYPWYITLDKVLNKFERIEMNTFEQVLNKFGHI